MNRIKKIAFCILTVSLILFSTVLPAFAVDISDTYTYSFPWAQPSADENHYYVELLVQNSSGWTSVVGLQFICVPFVEDNSDVITENLRVSFSVDPDGIAEFTFGSPSDGDTYLVRQVEYWASGSIAYKAPFAVNQSSTGIVTITWDRSSLYDIIGFHAYGDFYQINNYFTSSSAQTQFTCLYAEDASIYNELLQVNDVLAQLAQYDETIVDRLNSILSEVTDISDAADDIVSLLGDVLLDLDTLITNTDELEYWLNSIYGVLYDSYFLLVTIDENLLYSYWELESINEKLQTIIDILNSKGESEYSEVDTSNVDDYYNAENSLLDNSNVDVSNVVNVEVDQSALTVIWDLVEETLNTHPQVFGMVLTILSLGIIALILGR